MRRRPRHSTIPAAHPPRRTPMLRPQGTRRPPKRAIPAPPARAFPPKRPSADIARIIDDSDGSLVDVLDSLLNQGVMLNAELVLALANVDLVYLRLSALLCAADRVLPPRR